MQDASANFFGIVPPTSRRRSDQCITCNQLAFVFIRFVPLVFGEGDGNSVCRCLLFNLGSSSPRPPHLPPPHFESPPDDEPSMPSSPQPSARLKGAISLQDGQYQSRKTLGIGSTGQSVTSSIMEVTHHQHPLVSQSGMLLLD